jgi:hypothetical protein
VATVDGEKTGGRKKGTPNKSTEMLFECAARLGIDPFETMLLFAKGDHEALELPEFEERVTGEGLVIRVRTITADIMLKAAMKAAEFLYPKRKAIEVAGPADEKTPLVLRYANPKDKK